MSIRFKPSLVSLTPEEASQMSEEEINLIFLGEKDGSCLGKRVIREVIDALKPRIREILILKDELKESEKEGKESMEATCNILLKVAKKGEITVVNDALKELAAGFRYRPDPQFRQEIVQNIISGLKETGEFSSFFLSLAANHFGLSLEEVGLDLNEKITVNTVLIADTRKRI